MEDDPRKLRALIRELLDAGGRVPTDLLKRAEGALAPGKVGRPRHPPGFVPLSALKPALLDVALREAWPHATKRRERIAEILHKAPETVTKYVTKYATEHGEAAEKLLDLYRQCATAYGDPLYALGLAEDDDTCSAIADAAHRAEAEFFDDLSPGAKPTVRSPARSQRT